MRSKNGFVLSEEDKIAAYELYPKKERKLEGFQKMGSQIKSSEDYIDFISAIENYKKFLKMKGWEKTYTMQFATFCNKKWRDYVKPSDCGLAPEQDTKNPLNNIPQRKMVRFD